MYKQSKIQNPKSALALPACLAGMDACWIYTVAWMFSSIVLKSVTVFPVPSPFVLALLELGGWGLMVYLLDRTSIPFGWVRVIAGGVGVLLAGAVGLALYPFNPNISIVVWIVALLYVVLISLGLWMLGSYRASERVTYEGVYATFRLGLIAIAAIALFSTLISGSSLNRLWDELGGVALWFFALSLAGLALGNRELVRRETGNAGMKSWGWLVAVSVGGILLLGLFGQAFGAGDVVGLLQKVVTGVLVVVGAIIYGIIYAVLWPFSLLGLDVGPFGPPRPPPPPPANPNFSMKELEKLQRQYAQFGPLKIPVELQAVLMTLAALLIVAAALYIMTRWLRRTRSDRTQLEAEEREGFGSWVLFMSQVRAWLGRLLARFRPPTTSDGRPMAEDDLAQLQGRPEWSGTLSVRQIYIRLLKMAGTAGYPRAPQQTPVEYLRTLSMALPNLQGELSDITAAYVEARYGPMPASALAVQSANDAWRRAESVLSEGDARDVTRET